MTNGFLELEDEHAYRQWWMLHVAQRIGMPIPGAGSIPVFIGRDEFGHAFFESTDRRGSKDVFSMQRARRMHQIIPMIQAGPGQDHRYRFCQGYNNRLKQNTDASVAIVDLEDHFVVIVDFRRKKTKVGFQAKGEFDTCFVADQSFSKIINSSEWRYSRCCRELNI